MIKTSRLVVDFDRKFERFTSESGRTFRLEDKLAVINEALIVYFENNVRIAETDSEIRNNLRVLEKKEISLKKLKTTKDYTIFEIPDESYKILRQRIVASRKDCGIKEFPAITFQTDDLNNARLNPFWKSSFAWEHALADEGSDGMFIWHDDEFVTEQLIVDYYKKPQELHAPSMHVDKQYEDWNGIIRTKDQDLELSDTYSHKKIIDISILLGKSIIGDIHDFDIKLKEILSTEKI